MKRTIEVTFADSSEPKGGLAIIAATTGGTTARSAAVVDPEGVVGRAADVTGFRGKAKATNEILAPEGAVVDRIIVLGLGDPDALKPHDWLTAGGIAAAQLKRAGSAVVFLDVPGLDFGAAEAADFASGMLLGAYSFDTYKTKKPEDDDEETPRKARVTIVVHDPSAAKKAFAESRGVVDGVILARDLVNEPANVLGPEEFAERARALEELGVEVEVLGEKEMRKLGMGALLGVAQGSGRPPRLAVMQWNGGKVEEQAGRLRRQGRRLRYGRHLDQAGRRHGGHEGRHGRCRSGDRADACAGRAQGQGQRGRHHRPRREHAGRQRAAAGRHRDLDVRADDRGDQHGCGRPSRARRCALVLPAPLQAAVHGQPGNVDRRRHRRARAPSRRPLLQRRRSCRPAAPVRPRHPGKAMAAAAGARIRQADRLRSSPT